MKKNMTLFAGIFMILAIVCVSFGCDQASNDSTDDSSRLVGEWIYDNSDAEKDPSYTTFAFTSSGSCICLMTNDVVSMHLRGTYTIEGSSVECTMTVGIVNGEEIPIPEEYLESYVFAGTLDGSTLTLYMGGALGLFTKK